MSNPTEKLRDTLVSAISHGEYNTYKDLVVAAKSYPMDRFHKEQVDEAMQLFDQELAKRAQEPLKRLLAHSRETKDVKNGQVLQTIGKGWIFQEIDTLKTQTTEEDK